MGNVGARSAGAREDQRVPVAQQEQAATSSSHGLNTDSIPNSWRRHDPTQGSQAAGSRSDKTISHLRLPQISSTSAQQGHHSAAEALSNDVKTTRLEGGQEVTSLHAVELEDTASDILPVDSSAASLASPSDLVSSPPDGTPQLEEEAPVQRALSLAGAWNAALDQARVPSVFAAIPEEPTAAMLQYAAAPAQLPPSGMTCEAWLAQTDKRRSVSVSQSLPRGLSFAHCTMALMTCFLAPQHSCVASWSCWHAQEPSTQFPTELTGLLGAQVQVVLMDVSSTV